MQPKSRREFKRFYTCKASLKYRCSLIVALQVTDNIYFFHTRSIENSHVLLLNYKVRQFNRNFPDTQSDKHLPPPQQPGAVTLLLPHNCCACR